jgi:hypothetical protein
MCYIGLLGSLKPRELEELNAILVMGTAILLAGFHNEVIYGEPSELASKYIRNLVGIKAILVILNPSMVFIYIAEAKLGNSAVDIVVAGLFVGEDILELTNNCVHLVLPLRPLLNPESVFNEDKNGFVSSTATRAVKPKSRKPVL